MKTLLAAIIIMAFTLSGCASSPTPQLLHGYYFMTGDAACVTTAGEGDEVACYDKNFTATGRRSAMTDADLQAYGLQQMQARADRAALNKQLGQIGRTFQNAGQQALQQSQSQSVPTVQGIPSQGKATGYNQVGDTIIGTDGTSCQIVGQSAVCQ